VSYLKFETLQVRTGQEVDHSLILELCRFTIHTLIFLLMQKAVQTLFDLRKFGNIYTRLQNPTTDVVRISVVVENMDDIKEYLDKALTTI